MTNLILDHLLWAAPSLESGMEAFEALTGVRPVPGGVHDGQGTCNALVTLGDAIYLEVLAPDPAQDLTGTLGAHLAALPGPKLLTWAVKADQPAALAERLGHAEAVAPRLISMARALPGGGRLEWQILMFEGHEFGRLVPFAIDPAETHKRVEAGGKGCALASFILETPDQEGLESLLGVIGVEANVQAAAHARLTATLETPKGSVQLTSD